ncbi:M14 family metallopeptidase [Staphylococcus caprae]|uniref:M14 family metallopeptidase n=1 Tax=Staphylococcus caprae TaxID=29380 RepID=UPI003879EC70
MRKTIYEELDTIFGARFVRECELNFIATREMLINVEEILQRHNYVDKKAHKTYQIEHVHADGSKQSLEGAMRWFDARLRATLVPTLANDQQEILDARASIDGINFDTLGDRLGHDFNNLNNLVENELNVADDNSYMWNPPYIKGAMRGENDAPLHNDPVENLKIFWDKFVDNKYCRKSFIGKDQSNKYDIYRYTFEPQHYSKTIVVTSCIHGNEYSAFYALSRFMDLVVNHWHEHAPLANLRKNVRLIVVPIVNPWGFANQQRENSNNVDLNRNFDYYWENGTGTSPSKANYKGKYPFSEKESKNMKSLFEGLGDIAGHVDCHNIISQVSDYCLFYPRFANQPNNIMTQLLQDMSDYGDYVTWGSSTLASFSNWVGIKRNITSFLPEVYEGRAGQPRGAEEMWRSVYFLGNIILRLAQANVSKNGRTATEPIAKSFVYSDRYKSKGSSPFSLIATDKWQRMLMTQQRFKVTANGFATLHGSITVEVDRDTTFGVNPMVIQNYNPFSGNGKSDRRQLFKVEHTLKKGIHTIPIHAIAPIQMSTTSPENVHRTDEVMPVVEVRRSKGVCHVKNLVIIAEFTPSHSHNSLQMFQSGPYGNQKENTFEQIFPNKPAAFDTRNKIIKKKK